MKKYLKLALILVLTCTVLAVFAGCDDTKPSVKDGDTVNIDYVGMLDGVAFQGGTAKGYNLEIGSGNFIPGFEEQIIGMKVGQVKNIDVTFPANYHVPSLAGQPTVFKITLNAINGEK